MPLWTPDYIETALWLDAADADTITESSGLVSQWDDKSGNGRHATQATGSRQPLLDGGFIVFDGSNDYLTSAFSHSLYQNRSMFVVGKVSGGAGTRRFFAESFGSGSYPYAEFSLEAGDNNAVKSYGRSGADGLMSVEGSTWGAGDEKLVSVSHANGGALVLRENGAEADASSSYTTTTETLDGIYIGTYRDATGRFLHGGIKEIIFLDYDATEDTHQKIEGYLAWKWGLEAGLPVGHPYKSAAPVSFEVSGTVTNAAGGPASRTVRAYSRATGALVGETVSDIAAGAWEILFDTDPGEVTVLALADEVEVYNDIAHRVIPA